MSKPEREEYEMENPKQVVPGRVQKNSNQKFKIQKQQDAELDVDIDIEEDGDYDVEKLSIDGLPATMDDSKPNSTPIRWFNNFSIKKNGLYLNQSFTVKIAGISALKAAKKNLVIWDGNTNKGKPWVFTGDIVDDTIELTDGDPAVGSSPP